MEPIEGAAGSDLRELLGFPLLPPLLDPTDRFSALSRPLPAYLLQLTLTYNRTRQASITTELIEIISGATALAG